MNARKNRAGMALGTVLACLAAMTLILYSAVSATLSHLNIANHVSQQQHAQNLAEAALAEAMAQLAANDYQPIPGGQVVVTVAGLNDAEGTVSFNNTGDFVNDYSHSRLNDPNNTTSTTGARGRTVPESSVHLVARGRVGDIERWVECLYYRPPFPDGLVASGGIQASGLYLTGVRRSGNYSGGHPSTINPEDILPANLFSNSLVGSTSGAPAVNLEGNSEVNGSLGAVGSVSVNPNSSVTGEVLPGSEPQEIPELDLAAKMQTLIETSDPFVNSGGNVTLPDGWFSHAPSAVNINGDLDLNNSVLCVEGDLNITGAITGTGFLLVDGDVTVGDGGSDVTGSDQIALATSGDLNLSASTPEDNFFKGLVYAEGDVDARDITVVGAMVVNGKRGKAGTVDLENVRFVYNPGGVTMNLRKLEGLPAPTRQLGGAIAIRRSTNASKILVDFDLYISLSSGTPNGFDPDLPKTWDQDSSNGPGSPTAMVVSEKDVEFPLPFDQANPAFVSAADELATRLLDEVNRNSPSSENQETSALIDDAPPDYPRGLRRYILESLAEMIDQNPDTYELGFDLNNLLAEHTSESRVLLWQPWDRTR